MATYGTGTYGSGTYGDPAAAVALHGPDPAEKAAALLEDLPPYSSGDPFHRAVVGAAARELQRIEDFLATVGTKLRPDKADDEYRLLGLWEAFRGLPVEPTDATLTERRSRLLSAVRRGRKGAGEAWVDLLNLLLGPNWEHSENDPGDYQLTVTIPQGTGYTEGQLLELLANASPAHVQVILQFSDSFRVGISEVGDAL